MCIKLILVCCNEDLFLNLLILQYKVVDVVVGIHISLQDNIEPLTPSSGLEKREEVVQEVGRHPRSPHFSKMLEVLVLFQMVIKQHRLPFSFKLLL